MCIEMNMGVDDEDDGQALKINGAQSVGYDKNNINLKVKKLNE